VGEPELTLAMGHGGILEDSPFGIESKKLVMWLFICDCSLLMASITFFGPPI
jgi:hypothetical protein